MARHPGYPFEPKSNAHIRPGDFWGIPTRRGGWYCCGRVLAISRLSSRSIVVGLLDWCEPTPPTADAIAGARVLAHAVAHVKTIRETGGMLLGHRPLDLDGIADPLVDHDELDIGTWGYMHIEDLAHDRFGRHFAEHPEVATERPAVFLEPGTDDRSI